MTDGADVTTTGCTEDAGGSTGMICIADFAQVAQYSAAATHLAPNTDGMSFKVELGTSTDDASNVIDTISSLVHWQIDFSAPSNSNMDGQGKRPH
jgi:hypothetical protein